MPLMDTLIASARETIMSALNELAVQTNVPALTPELLDILTTVILILLSVVALLVLYLIVRLIYNLIMRSLFCARYHVPLPHGCRVRPYAGNKPASFSFQFPRWQYARKDGARDRRRANNRIIRGKNILRVSGFKVISRSPLNLMTLVSRLRSAGVSVPPCPAEEQKLAQARSQLRQGRALATAQGVAAAFAHDPTQFESYCAALFNRLGYQASVTPKTNDGGFDLVMADSNGQSCIAECKCYATGHVVGRPLVQKLVGANQTKQARRLLFITTSSFSSEAISYARETGVELIDGERLSQLIARIRAQDSLSSTSWDAAYAPIDRSEWELTRAEILANYPPDLRI